MKIRVIDRDARREGMIIRAGASDIAHRALYPVRKGSQLEHEWIMRQAQIQGLSDLVEDVLVPTEEVIEIRRDPNGTRLGAVEYGKGASSRSRNTDPRRW